MEWTKVVEMYRAEGYSDAEIFDQIIEAAGDLMSPEEIEQVARILGTEG